jgi:hypothetical protein
MLRHFHECFCRVYVHLADSALVMGHRSMVKLITLVDPPLCLTDVAEDIEYLPSPSYAVCQYRQYPSVSCAISLLT